MRTFNRFIYFCILCIVLFVLAFFLSSCGAKKKTVEKSQFTTEIATVERVNELTETETKTDISTSETSKETTTSKDENFTGESADPSKPATVTTEEKDGKQIKTYTNFKNVKTGTQNSESETNKDFGQKVSRQDLSKTDLTQKTQTDAKASGKTINKNLKVERGFPWHWVVLGLLIYSFASYLRKSTNPLKWFT